MKKGIIALEYLFSILAATIITICLVTFVLKPAKVQGNSMYPTLKNNERVLTSVISVIIDEPRRFDIVIIKRNTNEEWVKRVIALPYETVKVENNQLYINGNIVAEPFLTQGVITKDFSEIKLNADEYFVMGDNREHSMDSRFITSPIKRKDIIAKHAAVYFPFNEMRILK